MAANDLVDLVKSLKKGREYAWSTLNNQYYDALMRYAMYTYGVEETIAKELVNDTIRSAWRKIKSFKYKDDKDFVSWLFAILKNKIMDNFRAATRENERMLLVSYDESSLEGNDGGIELITIAKEVEQRCIEIFTGENIGVDERVGIISLAMDAFTSEEQNDLWCYFWGMTHKEIAELRNTNVVASRKHVNRLVHRFFQEVGIIINSEWEPMYENYKKNNS